MVCANAVSVTTAVPGAPQQNAAGPTIREKRAGGVFMMSARRQTLPSRSAFPAFCFAV
jgi:hypothetical protein